MVEPHFRDSYLGSALGFYTTIEQRPELPKQDRDRIYRAIDADDLKEFRKAIEEIDKTTLSKTFQRCIQKEATACFEHIIENYPYSGMDLKGIKSKNQLQVIARKHNTLEGWLNH